jgi:hypothetical protein
VTTWIDASLTPQQADIYVVRVPYIPAGEAYALWDGERWLCWGTTPQRAELVQVGGPDQGYDWRPAEWVRVV